MRLAATAAEFACLSETEYLSTAVLDCILQSTALLQDNAASEGIILPMIGSLGSEAWKSSCNVTASLTRAEVATQLEWEQHQYVH